MGDIVNLNKVRKSRQRAAKRIEAEANAIKHGRTKAERSGESTARTKADRDHAAHERDRTPEK